MAQYGELPTYPGRQYDMVDTCHLTNTPQLQFLHSLPSHFHTLLSRHEPAALVVLAHWAATLVHGAEASGCWLLRGLAGRLVEEIGGRLSGTDNELIRGLMGWVEGGG
jgi:hypothetical protein